MLDMDSPIDCSGVEEQKEIEPGEYKVRCSDVEVKATKAGTGAYIKAKFVVEGASQPIYHMFNVANPNETARNIGLSQLKTLASVNGHPNPDHVKPNELLNMEAVVNVTMQESDGYAPQPRITMFKKDFSEKAKKAAEASDNINF